MLPWGPFAPLQSCLQTPEAGGLSPYCWSGDERCRLHLHSLSSAVSQAKLVGVIQFCQPLTDSSAQLLTTVCQPAGLLFDWLYPAHFPLLLRCLEAWADEPAVTTALLKLFAELVLNRSQRLVFDSSSPNGILLFREVSKVGFCSCSVGL